MPRRTPSSGARPTIRDVASRAGVSTATVSRVLAGLGGASAAVTRKITKAAQTIGYRPNLSARGLRAKRRMLVGLVLPNLRNPFFTDLAHGVEEFLGKSGYTLLLGHSAEVAEREQRHMQVFVDEGVAGIVIVPSNAPGADYVAMATAGVPLVAVDRAPTGLPCDLVNTDNRTSARVAALHLLRLGYREIAFVNGPPNLDVSRARLAGVRDAIAETKSRPADLVVVNGDFQQAGGSAAMRELLVRRHAPRAVIVANNLMTLGALEVLHSRGLRIPEDIAIVCFDDMPWATSLRPPMTAIAQPAEELGRIAASLLLERLQTPDRPPRTITLSNTLNVRASCGALQVSRPA
ncbi:MAG: LacI family DNA-binding transcriptional regulator [Opitutaceae bacterium]|nr:LacI family DNA-binding transcriptional regulator [Opitutaceae bacterium]